jgi:hypothetical protein
VLFPRVVWHDQREEAHMRSQVQVIAGTVIALMGLLFSLQGFGAVGGSPMSSTTTWSILGPIIAAAGLFLVWLGARRRP